MSQAAFGTNVGRFEVAGVHPDRKLPGTYTEIYYRKQFKSDSKNDFYDVHKGPFTKSALESKRAQPGWKRSYELSKQMKMPHLLYLPTWNDKKEKEHAMGPGRYNTKDFIEINNEKPTSKCNLMDTKNTRYKDIPNLTPGPGTYDIYSEKKKIRANTIQELDQPGLTSDRSTSMASQTYLAPGAYGHKTFTEEILNKKTSKRGPYDLFSGTIGLKIRKSTVGPGAYQIPSFTDDHLRKSGGKFSATPRFDVKCGERIFQACLSQSQRNPTEPGPLAYEKVAMSKKEFNVNAPPFNINNVERDAVLDKQRNDGRYDIARWNKNQSRYSSAHIFKSDTKRFENILSDQYYNERIRPKRIHPAKFN